MNPFRANKIWDAFYRRLPNLQQAISFLRQPTSVAFGGGVTFIVLFYAVVIRKEWQASMDRLQRQLNESKQKWQTESLSLNSKVSQLELKLNRTELELVSSLESLPSNDGKWSRSVIEWKYEECRANKK